MRKSKCSIRKLLARQIHLPNYYNVWGCCGELCWIKKKKIVFNGSHSTAAAASPCRSPISFQFIIINILLGHLEQNVCRDIAWYGTLPHRHCLSKLNKTIYNHLLLPRNDIKLNRQPTQINCRFIFPYMQYC